jgi:precorrin-6B methylase 2
MKVVKGKSSELLLLRCVQMLRTGRRLLVNALPSLETELGVIH